MMHHQYFLTLEQRGVFQRGEATASDLKSLAWTKLPSNRIREKKTKSLLIIVVNFVNVLFKGNRLFGVS